MGFRPWGRSGYKDHEGQCFNSSGHASERDTHPEPKLLSLVLSRLMGSPSVLIGGNLNCVVASSLVCGMSMNSLKMELYDPEAFRPHRTGSITGGAGSNFWVPVLSTEPSAFSSSGLTVVKSE